MNKCLTCGKHAPHHNVRYFVVPGHIMVPNSYLLCDEHKELQYFFDDIYDENCEVKKIDHNKVIERSKK